MFLLLPYSDSTGFEWYSNSKTSFRHLIQFDLMAHSLYARCQLLCKLFENK